jgi:hypothetical protein
MNTNQNIHNPDGSDDLDTLLVAAYTHLVNDLSSTLDLGTGVTQATNPVTYSAFTDDLAQHLDLNTGLAAIVTGESLPPTADTEPALPHHAMNQARNLEHLRFVDAPTRLALRAAPAFRRLRDVLELAELIIRALTRDRAIDPTRARYLTADLDLLNRNLTIDLDLTPAIAHARALNLTIDRALTLTRGRNLRRARDLPRASTLDRILTRARSHALNLTMDLGLNLSRALNLTIDLTVDLTRARDLTRDSDQHLDPLKRHPHLLDLDRSIAEASQRLVAVSLYLIHHIASRYGLILGLRLDLGPEDRLDQSAVIHARTALEEVGDDFVGADLRLTQMHPDIVGLVGVRWSNDTQWPQGWLDCIRAASDEIGHGLFEITHTDGRRSPTHATT